MLERIYKDSGDMKEFIYILYGLARALPGDILEIGVRKGQSTRTFLEAIKGTQRKLFSIDKRAPKIELKGKNWYFIEGDSKEFPPSLEGRKFSLLMIDGDHSYEYALSDWKLYSPLVEVGGYVVFHDISFPKLGKTGLPNGAKVLWEELGQGLTLDLNKWGLGILRKGR